MYIVNDFFFFWLFVASNPIMLLLCFLPKLANIKFGIWTKCRSINVCYVTFFNKLLKGLFSKSCQLRLMFKLHSNLDWSWLQSPKKLFVWASIFFTEASFRCGWMDSRWRTRGKQSSFVRCFWWLMLLLSMLPLPLRVRKC